uniref:Uncharacterized protein n=1 Tax=Lepeophtheirus salmonis TaxID=72036 RepID=A0A0K2U9D5_LEPSM
MIYVPTAGLDKQILTKHATTQSL